MTTPDLPAPPNQLSSVQHIVQLMLENRSFDQYANYIAARTDTWKSARDASWPPAG